MSHLKSCHCCGLIQRSPLGVAAVCARCETALESWVSRLSGNRLSAMFAIWIASNAVEAFRIAFDRAYEVDDPRTFFENRALAIILVFVGAVVAALLGVSIILSPIIISIVDEQLPGRLPPMAGYATYAIGIIVFMGFMLLMHRVLPGRSMRGTRLWPGVIVTTVLWIAAARLFTFYLSSAASYTVTYGTLAGVIIVLMFFYITGATIIFGAEFNAAVDRRERHRNARMLLT